MKCDRCGVEFVVTRLGYPDACQSTEWQSIVRTDPDGTKISYTSCRAVCRKILEERLAGK